MTTRSSYNSSLNVYKQELRLRKPLSQEQELKVGRRIIAGDKSAIAELVEANTRYAFKFACKYNYGKVPFEDIVEAANMGLIEAAKRFDVNCGNLFQTYANMWMYKYIFLLLSEEKLNTCACDSNNEYIPYRSLDAYFCSDENGCLYDVLVDENSKDVEETTINNLDFACVMRGFKLLTPREQDTLVRFFGLGLEDEESLESIGKSYGISREAVRQSKERAIKKLRDFVSYNLVA